MKIFKSALAIALVASSGLVHAQVDPYQRCNGMYPAETYGAEERDTYIQECVQSANEAAANTPEPTESTQTEPPSYEGTVDQYVSEQPSEPSE